MKLHISHQNRKYILKRWLIGMTAFLFAIMIGAALPGRILAAGQPVNCFASPGTCGYPDPNYNNNVGSASVGVVDCSALPTFDVSNLPAGTYYSGSGNTLEITGNDVTISHLNMGDFNIYVSSGTDSFTFQDSCITAGDGTQNSIGMTIASGVTNTLIKDSTIKGAGTNIASSTDVGGTCTPGAGVSNGALGIAVNNNGTNTTIDGLYTYNVGSGAPGSGGGTNTVVKNSYQLINTIPACEHDEPIYFADDTITLTHNVLLNEESQTAAVFGDTSGAGACNNNLTMTDNLVAGGGYVIYPCGNATSVGTSTMDIENNRFARCLTTPLADNDHQCSGGGSNGSDAHGYYPSGGYYSVATYYFTGAGQTWSGNYWDDNLNEVNIDGSSGPPVDNVGPAVAVTSPNSNTYVNRIVAITASATASSQAAIHDVQFQVDNTNIANCDPTSPTSGSTYTCTGWDSTTVSNGTHTIKAIVTDSAGKTASSSETVTVTNNSSGPLTIWSDSDTPTNPDTSGDSSSINVGTKFQSSEPGYALGIRFYKGTGNTGAHIGSLWTSGGTLLASVTFANETASGWQKAFFSSPVAISANTTYVVSYYAPNGNYAADANYFDTSYTNSPLTALQSSLSGGNGVYAYVGANSFPDQTYNSANYWVDTIFSNSQYTVPLVNITAPASGSSVNGTESITADITENGGASISSVQFQVDGTDIANCDPTSPVSGSTYECSVWDTTATSNGTHAIQAVATDSDGAVVGSGQTVTIDNPTPTVSLTAAPTSIKAGDSSKLTWTSTNATSCTASGAWSGSKALSNSSGYMVSPTRSSTYTLTCSGSGGKATANATVTILSSSSSTASTTYTDGGSAAKAATTTSSSSGSATSPAPQSHSPEQVSKASSLNSPKSSSSDQSPKKAHKKSLLANKLFDAAMLGAICLVGLIIKFFFIRP